MKGKYFVIFPSFFFFFLFSRNKGREARARWRELVSCHGALFSPRKLMDESGFIVTYSTSWWSTNSAVTDTNGRWIGPRIVSIGPASSSAPFFTSQKRKLHLVVLSRSTTTTTTKLFPPREKHSRLEKQYDTASNMCKVFYYERKRGREKKENLNREFTLTRESSLRNFVSLYFKENKKRIKKIITLKKS